LDSYGSATAARPVHVVVFPAEVDVSNADRVIDAMDRALRVSGAKVMIADMTGTKFCDTSGVRSLILFSQRAAERGAELRVALSSQDVLQIFTALRIDLRIYPTLREAEQAGKRP